MEEKKNLDGQQSVELADEELKEASGGSGLPKRRPLIVYECDVCGWNSIINYSANWSMSFDEGLELMKKEHAEANPECTGTIHSR